MNNTFGNYLRARREAADLSLRQLSTRSGLDKSKILRAELDRYELRYPSEITAIARAFKEPLSMFVSGHAAPRTRKAWCQGAGQ